jgi:purine-cytosine permease-like protein
MEAFIRSNKAVWLMLIANVLAVVGWFIVKLNGGTEMAFPLFGLSGLVLWNILFFWARAQLNKQA